jgi:hypothetical protein
MADTKTTNNRYQESFGILRRRIKRAAGASFVEGPPAPGLRDELV